MLKYMGCNVNCKLQAKIDPDIGEEVVSGTFPSFASLTNPGIIESHKYTKGGSKLDCNMGQFCSAIYRWGTSDDGSWVNAENYLIFLDLMINLT